MCALLPLWRSEYVLNMLGFSWLRSTAYRQFACKHTVILQEENSLKHLLWAGDGNWNEALDFNQCLEFELEIGAAFERLNLAMLLQADEPCVCAIRLGNEFVVCALLNNHALLNNSDAVCIPNCWEPMCHDNRCTSLNGRKCQKVYHALENFWFH